jgi:hypothetical protein
VTDIYAEGVPGYVYYNLFMKVRNLPPAGESLIATSVSITGADSWNNLTFSRVATDSNNVTTLQASQTVNGTGIDYVLARKYVIVPVNSGTGPITCTPMGGGGIAYPVPITINSGGSSTGGSCTAPSDGKVYTSGQMATYVDWCPKGSAAAFCGSGTKTCLNGTWVTPTGASSGSPANANLASALTALEAVLKAMLAQLGR